MPELDRLEQLRKIAQGSNDNQSVLSGMEHIAAMRNANPIPGRLTSFSDQSPNKGRIVTESDQSLGSNLTSIDENE